MGVRSRAISYLVNEVPMYLFVFAFIGVQIYLWVEDYIFWHTAPQYVLLERETCGALSIARSSSSPIRFASALIIVAVCRNFISLTRFYLVTYVSRIFRFLDKSLVFHRTCAWSILFWTVVHSIAHMQNVWFLQQLSDDPNVPSVADWHNGEFIHRYAWGFASIAGFTGLILVFIMFMMYTSSLELMRRSYFEVFWYTHHMFIFYYLGLVTHGTGRLVQGQTPNGTFAAPPAVAWQWVLGPVLLYTIERMVRFYRASLKVTIVKVVQHSAKTFELQMRREGFTADAGQYIFLQCSNISALEWHPFTLTSSPEEDFFSVHIRVLGDWTAAVARQLGCDFAKDGSVVAVNPNTVMKVDGPFGTASEDAFDYEVAVFVGAGIGVTPFASLLKSVWYQQMQGINLKMKKVYFYWLVREKESFTWFSDLLDALEDQMSEFGRSGFIETKVFLTERLGEDDVQHIAVTAQEQGDTITGLKSKTFFGRPNWEREFTHMLQNHSGTDVGVFFCGPKAISSKLHTACNKYTDEATSTRFWYNKENF